MQLQITFSTQGEFKASQKETFGSTLETSVVVKVRISTRKVLFLNLDVCLIKRACLTFTTKCMCLHQSHIDTQDKKSNALIHKQMIWE